MWPAIAWLVEVTVTVTVAAAVPAHGQIWNHNLIVNSDAEAGPGMSEIDPSQVVRSVPGWKTTGAFTVVQYGEDVGGMTPDDPGPLDRGINYFAGGFGPATSSATQSIDLSGGAAEIDAGRVRFYLTGYLMIGSYGGSTRNPILTATFKDAAGKVLLKSVVNGPSEPEGGDMQVRATSGFLLPNTRSVDLVLDLTDPADGGRGDDFNLSSADNLSLMLTLEPVFGQNLVVNGNAETSPSKDGAFSSFYPVPGWNAANCVAGSIYVDTYDNLELPVTSPGPVNRGHLFVEDAETAAILTQTIDVTLAGSRIDAGGVTYHLAGDMGGDYNETITDAVTAEFLDATGKVLGNSRVGMSTPDFNGVFGLWNKTSDGPVPAGTRAIRVSLIFTEVENSTQGAWADNITLVLNSGAGPVTLNNVSSAATGTSGPVAPGEMVYLAVSGVNLNTTLDMQLDPSGLVATSLGNVLVYFDGWKAPLLSVNSSQIEAIAPFELDGKSSTVVHVEYQGVPSNSVTLTVVPAAPGIFTQPPAGNTAALVLDSQWQLVSTTNRAARGSTVTILFTGAGQTNPRAVDGHMEELGQSQPVQPVSVKIDGQAANLIYAGTLPGFWAGMMAAQVTVPSAAGTSNAVPVVITAGGASSPANAANMWVK